MKELYKASDSPISGLEHVNFYEPQFPYSFFCSLVVLE